MSAVRPQELETRRPDLRLRRRPMPASAWDWALLGLMLVAGAAFLLYETRGTVFLDDEWLWIMQRRGSSLATFLNPHNSHLSLVPLLIYKVLFALVGLRHYWPYRVVVTAAHLAVVSLVFIYARTRAGRWPALLGAALILFFGPGWQEFLWPFQMAWLIALGAGVGALLALDRGDRLGEIGACVLLTVSLASAGPGLAVAVGLVVEVALWRQRRRLWIVGIPIALYALWWVTYQKTNVSHDSVFYLTRFVFDATAGVLSSLAGLVNPNPVADTGDYTTWGAPMLIAAAALLAWRLHRLALGGVDSRPGPPRLWRIPGRLLTLLATALGFWLITGIGRALVTVPGLTFTSTGDESRYLYVGAVLVVLISAEALRGVRIPLRAQVVATVLVAVAVVSNVGVLRSAANSQRARSAVTVVELGVLDLTRGQVAASFSPTDFVFGVLQAGPYFQAQDAMGNPAASATQIAQAPDGARAAADRQLIAIHHAGLVPAGAVTSAASTPLQVDAELGLTGASLGACSVLTPQPFTPTGAVGPTVDLTLPPRGLLLEAGGAPATLQLRRFANAFEPLGTLAPGEPALLRIAPDRAPQPWHVRIQPGGRLRVCSAA